MRGRARNRADEEARHHAYARDQPPGHEGAAKRDPEAEDLGDGRDVGIREALVLEERHRHRARDAPAVEYEIEGSACDSERKGEADCPPNPMAGIAEGDSGQHRHDGENGHDQPTAPPPERTSNQRRIVLIEKWRPDKLELISK